MSKEGENKADDKALRKKKLVGIAKIVLFVSYSIATIIICYKCSISYNIYSNEICCSVVFFLIIFIYFAFYFWLHPKSEEKQGAFSWRYLALPIIFAFIWKSKGISFNDEQLYYWVFSTLAQVFGALLGLLVITITTIIFGFGHDASWKLECLENIKNEAKYLLYPAGLVLMYSIMALPLSQFLITSWYCKVIIIVLGIEVPILAVSTTPRIMVIFVRCRKEMMKARTK